jgi:hypothetical protein
MFDYIFKAVRNRIFVALGSDWLPGTLLLKFWGFHHLRDSILEKELKFQNANNRLKNLGVSWKFVNSAYDLAHNFSWNVQDQVDAGFGKDSQ